MSRWPITEEFFSPVLDQMERVLKQQRERRGGTDDAEGILRRGGNHHFGKSDSHMVQMGPDLDGFDEDDQVPHVILALLRLFMTALCVLRREKETESEKA